MDKEITLKDGTVMQVFTHEDLVQKLQKLDSRVMVMSLRNFGADNLTSYVFEHMNKDKDYLEVSFDTSKNKYLDCKIHIPAEFYPNIRVIGDDGRRTEVHEALAALGLEEHLEETLVMNASPDLKSGIATVDLNLMGYVMIEGKPVSQSIPVLLQSKNGYMDEFFLKTYLNGGKEWEKSKDWLWESTMVKEEKGILKFQLNKEYLYLYETGTMGFARFRRSRDYEFYGEMMSEAHREIIAAIPHKLNHAVKDENGKMSPFFVTPNEKAQSQYHYDNIKQMVLPVKTEYDFLGSKIYYMGQNVIDKGYLDKHCTDLTGRMTDIQVLPGNRLTCKIDGVQMEPRTLDPNDRMSQIFAEGDLQKEAGLESVNEQVLWTLTARLFRDRWQTGEQADNKLDDKERITHLLHYKRNDGAHFIRCKVDGEQRSFERLNTQDQRLIEYLEQKYGKNSIPYKEQLDRFAIKYFKDVLTAGQEETRLQGRKI